MQAINTIQAHEAHTHTFEQDDLYLENTITRIAEVTARTLKSATSWAGQVPGNIKLCLQRYASRCIVISSCFPKSRIALSYAYANDTLAIENRKPDSPIRLEKKTFSPEVGVECDGLHITYTNAAGSLSKKTIVYFLPNGALWPAMLPTLLWMSRTFEANVLCYNYRGTGHGKGTILGEEDLIQDGLKIVESIPSNQRLFLHGYSLGGGICMQVAGRLKERGREPPLANERSFSSLPRLTRADFWIGGIVVARLLKWCGWQLDSGAVLGNLKNHVIVMSAPDDALMRRCSLDAIANEHPAVTIHRIIMNKSKRKIEYTHVRDWHTDEFERYKDEVNKIFT